MSAAVKRVLPLLDRVLVKRAEAVTKTAGGIVIPEKAQAKVLQAQVVAVGPGPRTPGGNYIKMDVAVGDQVLLPEYGGTRVQLDGDDAEYHLFREGDILAKMN